jgi:hypothetical protein
VGLPEVCKALSKTEDIEQALGGSAIRSSAGSNLKHWKRVAWGNYRDTSGEVLSPPQHVHHDPTAFDRYDSLAIGMERSGAIIMILLSWNCRGLGNPQTVRELRRMVKNKHPHFFVSYGNKSEE